MNEVAVGIVSLFVMLALFLTGIELAVAMAVIGFLGFSYIVSFEAACSLIATDIFETFSSYGLTVIPLFIFMGQIAYFAGIADKLYGVANKFIGHVPGGLSMATIAGATLFKSICGSSPATTATFASVAVPQMEKFHYDRRLSGGTVASAGSLGILLPPSVSLIVFGIITEQSIGELFLAGIIPGLITAFFFMLVIYGWCRIKPEMGPAGMKYSWKERFQSLPEIIWPLAIFLVIIGGLMKGVFTPTEAGSMGTFAVIILVILKRNLNFRAYVRSVMESLRTACMVLLLVGASVIMGHFLAATGIPILASDWVAHLSLNRYVIVLLVCLVYEIGGSFIDDFAFMFLATPILFPIVLKLGFDPIWFGMLVAITLMIGGIIPPVAMNVFIASNVTKIPLGVVYKGALPFLIALFVSGALLFLFPELALFLPKAFMR